LGPLGDLRMRRRLLILGAIVGLEPTLATGRPARRLSLPPAPCLDQRELLHGALGPRAGRGRKLDGLLSGRRPAQRQLAQRFAGFRRLGSGPLSDWRGLGDCWSRAVRPRGTARLELVAGGTIWGRPPGGPGPGPWGRAGGGVLRPPRPLAPRRAGPS